MRLERIAIQRDGINVCLELYALQWVGATWLEAVLGGGTEATIFITPCFEVRVSYQGAIYLCLS